MTFRDIYHHYKVNRGNYIDLETNKIIKVKKNDNFSEEFDEKDYYCCHKSDVGVYFRSKKKKKNDCNSFCSETVKKILYAPFELDIKSRFQALDYYLSNNNNYKEEINEMKNQLEKALKVYEKLPEDDEDSDDYWFVIDTVGRISEEIMELGISYIEDYYEGLNEIEYARDLFINNNIEYEEDTYDLFVEQFKGSTEIIGWEEIDNHNMNEYIKIMDIDIPNKCEHYIAEYPDFKYLLFKEKMIFEVDSHDDFWANVYKNENWKPWQLINSRVRSLIGDFDHIDLYRDFYLLYNNTEKKYNYYDEHKKNEILLFALHEGREHLRLYVKKIIL